MANNFTLHRPVIAAGAALLVAGLLPAAAEEYETWHQQIGVSPGVQQSAGDGQGTGIAILDTGVNPTSADLAGAANKAASISLVGGSWTDDRLGHGTAVASVALGRLNGSGMVGVAPGASLIAVKIGDAGAYSSDIAQGVRHAVEQGAHVINLSFGSSGWTPEDLLLPELTDALRTAASSAVIVFAAGNQGEATLTREAMHLLLDGVAGSGIVVGSVAADNQVSWFSNGPGEWAWDGAQARDFYLTAPGEALTVATRDGGTRKAYGTSYSTPAVAGAAALVKARDPHLTPQQVVDILLSTAQDLGDPGTDTLYGRGLLRVDRALEPVGMLSVAAGPTVDDAAHALDASVISTGAALGNAAGLMAALDDAVAFDAFGRTFRAGLGSAIGARIQQGLRLPEPLVANLRSRFMVEQTLSPGLWVAATVDAGAAWRDDGTRPVPRLMRDPTDPRPAPGEAWAFGGTLGADSFAFGFGPGALDRLERMAGAAPSLFLTAPSGSAQPVLGLAEGGAYGHVDHRFSDLLSVGASFTQSDLRGVRGEPDARAGAFALRTTLRPVEGLSVDLTQSFLDERDAALGSLSSGALDLGRGAGTLAFGVGLTAELGAGFSARAHVTEAFSSVTPAGGSLLRGYDGLRSRAMGVSVAKQGVFGDADGIGLSVSRPLRLEAGSATLDVPVGRTLAGEVVYDRRQVGLEPDGQQMDIELSYRRAIGGSAEAGLHVIHQEDVGHVEGERASTVIGRLRVAF